MDIFYGFLVGAGILAIMIGTAGLVSSDKPKPVAKQTRLDASEVSREIVQDLIGALDAGRYYSTYTYEIVVTNGGGYGATIYIKNIERKEPYKPGEGWRAEDMNFSRPDQPKK